MVNFENGILVKGAYVEINGVEYPVHMPEYSGDTPLSKENMNKLQQDLADEIAEINNKLYKHQSYSLSTSITSGGWRNVNSTNYSVTLPKGKYLLIIGIAITANSSGMATLRPTINGSEQRTSVRQTIPLNSGLTMSTQVITTIEQETEGLVTINGQVYSNVNCEVGNEDIKIIQL